MKKLIITFVISFSIPLCSLASADMEKSWDDVVRRIDQKKREDRRNGWSYIISGALVGLGGIAGTGITDDPAEKGLYSVFQTIGVASVGYGFYYLRVGDSSVALFDSYQTVALTPEQKIRLWNSYQTQMKIREKREDSVRAITHGMIAALNFYNASLQKGDGIRNALLFVGGANLLAMISFSLD